MTFCKYLLILAILAISVHCFSQDKTRTDSIVTLKAVLQQNNMVATQFVGNAGIPSRDWYCFAYLIYLCRNEELVQMTSDSSPAVRLYSYIALVHNKYTDLAPIKNRLSADTASLTSFQGCILESITVADGVASIDYWYHKESTITIIETLRKDEEYRNTLYIDIINKKPIRR